MLIASNTPFILGTYAIFAGLIGGYSYWLVRRGRELARQVDDADKYWT